MAAGLFTFLIILVSLALGIFVLVQNPKGGGLASGFTGGAQIGGVQRTTDFLEKGTWYLMIALFVLCILSASVYNTGSSVDTEEVNTTAPVGGEDIPE